MTLFFRHAAAVESASPKVMDQKVAPDPFLASMRDVVDTLCDEERLDLGE